MPLDNKISNVLGAALPYWLKDQLKLRSDYNTQDNRDDANILYLANKTAWIRVVSSVNINGESLKINSDMDYFKKTLGISDITYPSDLAKKYVLFGGTSQYLDPRKDRLRSGLGYDGAYGMLGDEEIQLYGYRPMPGITDARIETQGRLGSIKMATINFKVWDKRQLDVIDALYFKLGYTMLVEWGHTVYVKSNPTTDQKEFGYTELEAIDPFQDGITKEQINLKIGQNVRKTAGNYDGMLGMVTQFNFSFTQEGGYDCFIKVIGLGIIGDSLKINNPSKLPDVVRDQVKQYLEVVASAQLKKQAEEQMKAQEQANAETQKQIDAAKADPRYQYFQTQLINAADEEGADKFKYVYESDLSKYVKFAPNDIITHVELNKEQVGAEYNKSNFYYSTKEVGPQISFFKLESILRLNSADKDTTFKLNLPYLNTLLVGITTDFSDLLAYNQSSVDYYSAINNAYVKNKNVNTTGIVTDVSTSEIISDVAYRDVTISYTKENTNYSARLLIPRTIHSTNNKLYIPDIFENNTYSANATVSSGNNIRENIKAALINPNLEWKPTSQLGLSPLGAVAYETETQTLHLEVKTNITFTVVETLQEYVPSTTGQTAIAVPNQTVNYTFPIYLIINDAAIISDFTQTNGIITTEQQIKEIQDKSNKEAEANREKNQAGEATSAQQIDAQIDSSLKYQSNLELAIKAIELYGLTQAVKKSDLNIDIGYKVFNYPLSKDENRKFFDGIMKYSIYGDFLSQLFDGSINDQYGSDDETYVSKLANDPDSIKVFAKYGFNSALMAGKATSKDIPAVNYEELTTIYVIPYEINEPVEGGGDIVHPVYVQLGFLLMIMNAMCTMYEASENGRQTSDKKNKPLVYIDYNPETNFCLSEPLQFTTNPFDFLIGFQTDIEKYKTLFNSNLLEGNKISAPTSGSTSDLYDPIKEPNLSNDIPKFKTLEPRGAYRGKTMKILISCEYILNTLKDFSNKDGMNSVYLKPFLDNLVKDLNKSLGGINIFRVAYDDSSNCFSIVDDQIQPLAEKEVAVSQGATDQIPVYGKNSIAKSLNIQTEISSNLGNMIAISANSNSSDQSANSINASSFGFINNSYKDRYIPIKTDLSPEEKKMISGSQAEAAKEKYDSLLKAAQKFNDTVRLFYSTVQPNKADVAQATGYYIERMSKITNNLGPTRSSAMIPVSVDFKTDGIAGFSMGQAFTLPPDILPYTYSTRATPGLVDTTGGYPHADAKVAFATVGLTHTIQNNVWDTDIKGSMILIKDQKIFDSDKINILYSGAPLNIPAINAVFPGSVTIDPNVLKVSGDWINRAFQFIASKEGFEEVAKPDAGRLRGGYGSDKKLINNELRPVVLGMTFTRKEAEDTLRYEIISDYSKRVINRIGQVVWDKLSDNQKASLTSYVYNVGSFKNFDGIPNAIISGNYLLAAQLIASGPYTSEKIYIEALKIRRLEESALFSKIN